VAAEKGAEEELALLDDDLAEGPALQVVERGGQVGQGVARVDHRLEPEVIQGAHEVLMRPPGVRGEALERGRLEQQRDRGARHLGARHLDAADHADRRDASARAPPAAPGPAAPPTIARTWSAPRSEVRRQAASSPEWRLIAWSASPRASARPSLSALPETDNHLGPAGAGDLGAPEGYAARALHQHGLAGAQAPLLDRREPR
jgi:hypothetical protein